MINAAVVGYGNIGKFTVEALKAAPDFSLSGVVRRTASLGNCPAELNGVTVTDSLEKLGQVDVAILCTPSRLVPETAEKYLRLGVNTVDSYDIHTSIYELKTRLEPIAKEHNAVSVISCGWDPGSDSLVRALLEACAPKGITYTNFGEGMSMGHSTAVKSMDGVENALSVTIPTGQGIHRRMVYVQLKDGADFKTVEKTVKEDDYFVHDETHVINVPDVKALIDMGHGVNMVRKGVSGGTHNQLFEFNMRINNPALTGQILVSCARAAMKRTPGAYTLLEIPVIDLLYGERSDIIRRLV